LYCGEDRGILGRSSVPWVDFGSGKLLAAPKPLEERLSLSETPSHVHTEMKEQARSSLLHRKMKTAICLMRQLQPVFECKCKYDCVVRNRTYHELRRSPGPLIMDRYPYTLPYSGVRWDFSKYVPQVVVINLGTNDFLHHLQIKQSL